MALLPDVHVSLDRPTIQHIYQLFLPILPGGALTVGLLLAHPGYFRQSGALTGIGYYSRLSGLVFISYVAGLVLYALSVNFSSAISFSLAAIVFSTSKLRPIRQNGSISQNHVWRTVAAEFLGARLIPNLPNVQGASLFTCAAHFPLGAPPTVQQYDIDWNDWYNVLQDYVLRRVPLFPPDLQFFVAILQATTWAIFIGLVASDAARHHVGLLALITLLLLLTAAAPFGTNYLYLKYDRLTAPDFTARLVAEIRARGDVNQRATSSQTADRTDAEPASAGNGTPHTAA